MKNQTLLLFLLSLLINSCLQDDAGSAPIIGGGSDEVCTINKSGFIESDELWEKECIYILNNKVVVPSGVTLTIEASIVNVTPLGTTTLLLRM